MRNKRYRRVLEILEQRRLLAADLWYVDSEQPLGTNTDGAQFGDLDGDDDLDLIVGCRAWPFADQCTETVVWLNDGSGQFSKGWSVDLTNVGSLKLGDLDGDGDLDAFVSRGSPTAENPGYGVREVSSEVWLNDGQGNFDVSVQRVGDNAIDVVLGDVDGDGDLDAITAHPVGASRVLLNDGQGVFTDSEQDLGPSQWTFDVALGDLDGDGDLDAYFAKGNLSPSDLVYINDGLGNFTDSGQKLDNSFTGGVQLGDLDGDGDLDAFLANGHEVNGVAQPNRVYLNDGSGTFTDSGQRLGMSLSNIVELADLDDDGDLDAWVANGTRQFGHIVDEPNEIWFNDGAGVFTPGQDLGDAANWATSYRVALGDIDNDGDVDAFIGNLFAGSPGCLYVKCSPGNQILINTQALPWKGNIAAVETNIAEPPTLFVDASGSGNASGLGAFDVTYQFEVELATLQGSGQAQFVTANGESLVANVTGQATQTEEPDVVSIVETYTIASGTGRFAGASGSFILERSLNQVTGVTSGEFIGNIRINTHPLRGDIESTENAVDPNQSTFAQIGTGTGNATHLGNFAMTYEIEVETATLAGVGTAQFVAADGDSMFTTVTGQGTIPNPFATVVEIHTITGGTGRFANAFGTFTSERVVNTETGSSSGSFDGDISFALPGDLDNDGNVAFADFLILSSNFGRTDAVRTDGDLNGDHAVDFDDFLILANNFGLTS